MSAEHTSLSHHPAPHRHRVATASIAFGVLGGPLAWFVQLCAGYALASAPCYTEAQRAAQPLADLRWTSPAIIAVLITGVIVALAAFAVSYRSFARTRYEAGPDQQYLMEVGAGRTRFLALWGLLLGAGFAVATALTAVAFVILPRCAG